MPRDDFSAQVVTEIAKRSGYLCAFPSCRALTVGPSDKRPGASSSIGVACHITAASEDGPRFDPSLTPEQRASESNGILMCANHSREIDNDEVRYPVATLRAWKAEAEARARTERGRPLGPKRLDDPLLVQTAEFLRDSDINEAIGSALANSGASTSLGEETTLALRDFLIEIAKNAIAHGSATRVTFSIEPRRLVLLDDGKPFNPASLLAAPGRGGREAFEILNRDHPGLAIAQERFQDLNQLTVVPLAHAPHGAAEAPCTVTVQPTTAFRHNPWPVEAFQHCGTVFVSLPPYLSISDTFLIGPRLQEFTDRLGRDVILIVSRYSPAVLRHIQGYVPTARIIARSH